MTRLGVLERYGERLPIDAATPRISLGEGDTPLVESAIVAGELRLGSLHFKLEGLNPTGSFKDRGMVVAVARALQRGARAILCASTGNTSASAAAYGARFGLRVGVVIPARRIAVGKLVQAQVHGAQVMSVEGSFDVALRTVRAVAERYEAALVNSVNPDRIEGQKTAAFEIVETLGDAPDVLVLPVGNAGNITAYWRGFREYREARLATRLPRMIGAQAAGAAPLVLGKPVADPVTVASAIRIGNPASWDGATAARDESEGLIDSVTDSEILDAQQLLATREGIFCEPASAASVALLAKAVRDGRIAPGSNVVCVLTGSGLKDVDAVASTLSPPIAIDAEAEAVARVLEL